jgi:hypothetical protein
MRVKIKANLQWFLSQKKCINRQETGKKEKIQKKTIKTSQKAKKSKWSKISAKLSKMNAKLKKKVFLNSLKIQSMERTWLEVSNY